MTTAMNAPTLLPLLLPQDPRMTTLTTQALSPLPPPLVILPGPRITHVSSRSPPPLILINNASGNRREYPANVSEKFRRQTDNDNASNPDDPDNDCYVVPPSVDPLSLTEEYERAMTQVQNCNEFSRLCLKAVNLVSQCNREQYLARCTVMENLITRWSKNEEVVITSIMLDEEEERATNEVHQPESPLVEDDLNTQDEPTGSTNDQNSQGESNLEENNTNLPLCQDVSGIPSQQIYHNVDDLHNVNNQLKGVENEKEANQKENDTDLNKYQDNSNSPSRGDDSECSSNIPNNIDDVDWTQKQNEVHKPNEKNIFMCDFCHRVYKNKKYLELHQRVHTRTEKPYQCKFCRKKFERLAYLRVHVRSHSEVKPYGCPICKARFNIQGNLTTHFKCHMDVYGSIIVPQDKIEDGNKEQNQVHSHKEDAPLLSQEISHCVQGNISEKLQDVHSTQDQHKGVEITKDAKENPSPNENALGDDSESSSSVTEDLGDLDWTEGQNEVRTHNNQRSFKCDVCGRICKSEGALRIHHRVHTGEKPYECTYCGKKFAQIGYFNVHVRNHSAGKSFECSICQKKFGRHTLLKKHLRSQRHLKMEKRGDSVDCDSDKDDEKIEEKSFMCEVCSMLFSSNHRLRVHQRVHTGERPFECTLCSKKFAQRANLRSHIRTHSVETPFECTICGKKFKTKRGLSEHYKYHEDIRPFECTVCNKRFRQKNMFKKHFRTHTGEKPFKCEFCEKMFNQKHTLQNHTRLHTGEKPFECKVCCKKFRQKGALLYHLKTHTGEQPFECDICGNKFTHKSSLKNHRILIHHTGEKPEETKPLHQCPICNKKVKNRVSFRDHQNVHTGEKPYQCTICPSRFSFEANLKTHLKRHAGTNNFFECTYCNKKFSEKGNLQKHVRLHTGEKPYECTICNKSFSQSDTLKSHVRTHTGEKPYECTVCNKRFTQSGCLKKHLKTHAV